MAVRRAAGSGTSLQVTAPLARDRGELEQAGAQVGPARGGEAVEAPVDQVLGQVHAPPARVHGRGLVLEHAHGGMAHGLAPPGGVALPDEPGLDLLAGQPGAPRGPASGAVLGGSVEDPVRVGHPARGGRSGSPRRRPGASPSSTRGSSRRRRAETWPTRPRPRASGSRCPATRSPPRATTLEVKPSGSRRPSSFGGRRGP